MFPARRLLIVVASLFAALPFLRSASPFASTAPSHVQATLVSADAAIQPGHSLTVALRLIHDEHWHTYWVNPGTGLATTLSWKLPPGWKAGEIQWPAPHILRDRTGMIIGQGYEGDILLPITLTPPADLAPNGSVRLNADADWLMCEDVCIPGSASLSLTLPVAAGSPPADNKWADKIKAVLATLPREDAHWKLSATREGKLVTLTVSPTNADAPKPTDLRFFAEDGLIAYDQPQPAKADGKGGFVLTLSVAAEGPANPTRLLGVLTSENGWLSDSSLRGLKVDVPLEAGTPTATTAGGEPKSKGTFAGTLLLAFVGGLILNLMPCVFPVLGIKILGFVNQAGHQRKRVIAHGLAFALGVLLSFWSLAGMLAVLRASGAHLGWGFQLQSPAFVYCLAVLLLIFGLNMSGVFEFGLSATAVGSDLQSKSGYAGSFFSGVLATVVATPCSAPFLAPALGAALAVPPVESFTIFTLIAIGLSLPYLLLSIFPQAVKLLPRPGAWMETFKQVMAFPLYATTAYLLWVLAAQTGEEGFRDLLFSLVLIAMGIWVYGRWHAPGATSGRARFAVIGLIVLGLSGLWLGWPRAATPVAAKPDAPPEVVWEPWSSDTVAKLRAENRIVYVDFTARWCATCQTNKGLVFHNEDVLRYFAANKIVTLRADWTKQDPRITAELAKYGRSAVPFNLIWLPGKSEPIVLPEILTASTVLDILKKSQLAKNTTSGESI